MAKTLDQMCCEMKEGLVHLRSLEPRYSSSVAFHIFLNSKEKDYEDFLRLVGSLGRSAYASDVVEYLRQKKAPTKFLGMTQRTGEYFNVTKKLMKEIEAGR